MRRSTLARDLRDKRSIASSPGRGLQTLRNPTSRKRYETRSRPPRRPRRSARRDAHQAGAADPHRRAEGGAGVREAQRLMGEEKYWTDPASKSIPAWKRRRRGAVMLARLHEERSGAPGRGAGQWCGSADAPSLLVLGELYPARCGARGPMYARRCSSRRATKRAQCAAGHRRGRPAPARSGTARPATLSRARSAVVSLRQTLARRARRPDQSQLGLTRRVFSPAVSVSRDTWKSRRAAGVRAHWMTDGGERQRPRERVRISRPFKPPSLRRAPV